MADTPISQWTETLMSSAAAGALISRAQFRGSFQEHKFFVSTVLTPLTRFSLDFSEFCFNVHPQSRPSLLRLASSLQ